MNPLTILRIVLSIISILIIIVLIFAVIKMENSFTLYKILIIQFFISAIATCIYFIIYNEHFKCLHILKSEALNATPSESAMIFMLICFYLSLNESISDITVYAVSTASIFFNWVPAIILALTLREDDIYIANRENIDDVEDVTNIDGYTGKGVCKLEDGTTWKLASDIIVNGYGVVFLLLLVLFILKLWKIKEDFQSDRTMLCKVIMKMTFQYLVGFMYIVVLLIYSYFSRDWKNEYLRAILIFYTFLNLIMCFIMAWSVNLKNSLKRILHLKIKDDSKELQLRTELIEEK